MIKKQSQFAIATTSQEIAWGSAIRFRTARTLQVSPDTLYIVFNNAQVGFFWFFLFTY